jgi:CubicO group peptidase (beta-lactamase class C family)
MNSDVSGHFSGFDSTRLAAIRPGLQAFVDSGELAGIVTLTSHRGEIVQSDAIGWRDIESASPMRPDTLFRIASMSKPVTSVAALMLIEEGKIALDDPVTRWIPELANLRVLRDPAGPLDNTVPAKRDITVDDLFTHRAGIAYAPFSEGPLKSAYEQVLGNPGMNRLSVDQWLGGLGTLPLAHQPGDRFHYGHSSDVLGFLIGRVEGKPFRQVLLERIFGPLGMRDTDFWMPPEKRDRLASLYTYDAGESGLIKVPLELYDAPPEYTPGGGGLISSAPDYHRFLRMLMGEGEHDGVRVLRPETVRLMQTNRLTPAQREVPFVGMPLWQKAGFGLGVAIAEELEDNPYAFGATGSITWPGVFGTWWQADPANDLIMIYMIQHQVPVSAHSGSTIAKGIGAAGRRALPVYQQGIYAALDSGRESAGESIA